MNPAEALLHALKSLLHRHPRGLSEFDLLRQLQREQGQLFDEGMFRDNLSLFRAHFLLFHALYRLNDQLTEQRQGLLDIHVLNIRWRPWRPGMQGLISSDPLRNYYLDLSQLEQTTAEDVEALLGSFWSGYLVKEERVQALAVLGLNEDAERHQIERSYRRLAMRLHPDRGGQIKDFQVLQQAIQVLRAAD